MPYCDFEVADETGKVLFDKVHDDVEVNFIWLVTLGIECMLQRYNIWMIKLFHDL